MLFTSFNFLLFLCITVLVWHHAPNSYKNMLLFLFNIFFYAFLGAHSVVVLAAIIAVSYIGGLSLQNVAQKQNAAIKKATLAVFLILLFGTLVTYKYAFFLLSSIGGFENLLASAQQISILAPIGLSFYTFTATGYLIDVYRGKYQAERNFISFGVFVSFFPTLLSGPIPRGDKLLPQINKTYSGFNVEAARSGVAQFLYGAFMKLVVADNLGVVVSTHYTASSIEGGDGLRLFISSFLFGIQLYCDFYSYTLMARGAGLFFNIELPENFKRPYFARSIKDFWRRWHISLSSWFRDYLYFPLGGSKKGVFFTYLNTMIVFTVSGLWHGAGLNFIAWGMLHGGFLVLSYMTDKPRTAIKSKIGIKQNGFWEKICRPIIVFIMVDFAWIFFNVPTLYHGILVLRSFLTINYIPSYIFGSLGLEQNKLIAALVGVVIIFVVDVFCEKNENFLSEVVLKKWSSPIRIAVCYLLLIAIMMFGNFGGSSFVYFNF